MRHVARCFNAFAYALATAIVLIAAAA